MLSSALTLVGLAAFAVGQKSKSSCPVSSVSTSTLQSASIVYADVVYETRTDADPLTFTTTVTQYNSTTTLTHTPDVHTVNETTGTTTAVDPTSTTYTLSCTSNSTVSAEYTSTEYTGSFSPSSVRTTCIPTPVVEYEYASGTSTATPTETVWDTTYTTSYTQEVSTKWLSGLVSTPTTTVQVDETVLVPGVTTLPNEIDCFPTEYTSTASTTTTLSAACAPSNLINHGGITDEPSDPYIIQDDQFAAAHDASACCQVCVEDEACAAMIYVDISNDPSGLCRIYNGTESCGFAAGVGTGSSLQGQSGCGFIAENIAWGGER
ncbi:hypothetical protein Q7P37_011547 [Cladosporium fusiforme]